jgi:hypothetical protein
VRAEHGSFLLTPVNESRPVVNTGLLQKEDVMIDEQVKLLMSTISAMRALHVELVDDPSLHQAVPVVGQEPATVNVPAMHLLAGIRQLQTARAALARSRPSSKIIGPISFTCDAYGHPRSRVLQVRAADS